MNTCLICTESCHFTDKIGVFEYKCDNCGEYFVLKDDYLTVKRYLKYVNKLDLHILSGIVFEMLPNVSDTKLIRNSDFAQIIESASIPTKLRDRLDKILLYAYRNTNEFQQTVYIGNKAISYSRSKAEMENLKKALAEEGYIKTNSSGTVNLTTKGYEYVEKLIEKNIESNRCFVAMQFNPELNNIFTTYIKPAIEGVAINENYEPANKSYKPIRIDFKDDFNDDIIDEIIGEIRRSKFIVADFTGNRGGVYFEAGFAYGLGLKVIYTCNKEYFDSEGVHFDVNHKNFILWNNGEELYERLRNRISATIF